MQFCDGGDHPHCGGGDDDARLRPGDGPQHHQVGGEVKGHPPLAPGQVWVVATTLSRV